jgi:hypothetical protein
MKSALRLSLKFHSLGSVTETAGEVMIHCSTVITLNFRNRSKIELKKLFIENMKRTEAQKRSCDPNSRRSKLHFQFYERSSSEV